jgi:hypothetical protein
MFLALARSASIFTYYLCTAIFRCFQRNLLVSSPRTGNLLTFFAETPGPSLRSSADVVTELIFSCVWSENRAVVGAEVGVWDLRSGCRAKRAVRMVPCQLRQESSYGEISSPPQRNDLDRLILAHFPIPPVCLALEFVQLLLYT